MILFRYILKEIFKNQMIIIIIIFSVCFCQKFVKNLDLIVDQNISISLILMCSALSMPELGKLIIPFSAFISVLITFYRFHMCKEIVAMYVCGVSKYILLQSVFIFSIIVMIFSILNVTLISPYCSRYQNSLLSEICSRVDLTMITSKKFQLLMNKYLVFFTDNIYQDKLNHIFLVNRHQNNYTAFTIIVADKGKIDCSSQRMHTMILNQGMYYEILNKRGLFSDISVTSFDEYQMCFLNNFRSQSLSNINQKKYIYCMSMYQLWKLASQDMKKEFHWRLTLCVSVVIMSMVAALLFIVVSYDYFFLFLIAIALYIIFFLLHIILCFYISIDQFFLIIWIWFINFFYVPIVWLFNFQNLLSIKFFLKFKLNF